MAEREAMKGSLERVGFTNPLRYGKDLAWPVGGASMVNSRCTEDVEERREGRMVQAL